MVGEGETSPLIFVYLFIFILILFYSFFICCVFLPELPLHQAQLHSANPPRSGTLYYKPNLQRSCCPHYTMRCVHSLRG